MRRPRPATASVVAFATGRGVTITDVDDQLFIAHTDNQRRVLEPIVRVLRGVAASWRPANRSATGLARFARLLRRVRRVDHGAHHMLTGDDLSVLLERLTAAAQAFVTAEATLAAVRPRVIVIANQHSVIARAWLAAAWDRGIASVYIPHAPTADVPHYRDLPVGRACVWGPRDLKQYGAWGADKRGLFVTGCPVELPSRVGTDLRDTVIYAPSPVGREGLEWQVERLRAAIDDVVVCLHPRLRLDDVRHLLPPHWRIADGPTVRTLCQGPLAVVQANSGVGLEALALDIPVIHLGPTEPTYLYLRHPDVPTARTSVELTVALRDIRSSRQRGRWRGFADGWLASSGRRAAESAAEIIQQADGANLSPVLNAWALGM